MRIFSLCHRTAFHRRGNRISPPLQTKFRNTISIKFRMSIPENMKLQKIIKEFIKPRLTTHQMENSPTRCGCDHRVLTMFYDDSKPHFPTSALGSIDTGQGWKILATWNQHGECTVNFRRMTSFDLVTPAQREIEEAKPVFIGLFIFILFILSILIQ